MDFEKLANENKDAVYRQMLCVCGNREDAEDVLVEALLREYRDVYELRDLRETPGDEVAKRLGISRAAMKSRLHQARELLRTQLDAALVPSGHAK